MSRIDNIEGGKNIAAKFANKLESAMKSPGFEDRVKGFGDAVGESVANSPGLVKKLVDAWNSPTMIKIGKHFAKQKWAQKIAGQIDPGAEQFLKDYSEGLYDEAESNRKPPKELLDLARLDPSGKALTDLENMMKKADEYLKDDSPSKKSDSKEFSVIEFACNSSSDGNEALNKLKKAFPGQEIEIMKDKHEDNVFYCKIPKEDAMKATETLNKTKGVESVEKPQTLEDMDKLIAYKDKIIKWAERFAKTEQQNTSEATVSKNVSASSAILAAAAKLMKEETTHSEPTTHHRESAKKAKTQTNTNQIG
jgi:hypothetical protein